MKKLPIGIQSFEQTISDGYVYVDKTAYIHRLLSEGKVYFLYSDKNRCIETGYVQSLLQKFDTRACDLLELGRQGSE
jgi:hypothetical protein